MTMGVDEMLLHVFERQEVQHVHNQDAAMVRYLISGRITMIPTRTSTHFILIDDAALHIKWYFMDVSLRTPMRIYVFVVPPLRKA